MSVYIDGLVRFGKKIKMCPICGKEVVASDSAIALRDGDTGNIGRICLKCHESRDSEPTRGKLEAYKTSLSSVKEA